MLRPVVADNTGQDQRPPSPRRYTWPWFVLVAFLMAIVLAIIWLSFEIKRTQRIRDLNAPANQG